MRTEPPAASARRLGDFAPAGSTARGEGGRPAAVALALTIGSGVLIAGQARVNGALAVQVGAAVPAALASFATGTAAVALLLAASGRSRGALRRRPREPVRWWYCLGGLGGAAAVALAAAAVPLIGVALLGVCVVAGQTVGGLAFDRAGIGPGGRRPATPARLLGAGLAVAAVGLAARGPGAVEVRPLLFAVLALGGAMVAGQQAVNGQLQRVTGDARVAALVSFVVGTLALALLTLGLAATGNLPPLHWPAEPGLYLGGLGGAAYIVLAASTVRLLGVLRLTLATVAGQLLGAVALDLVVPAHGQRLALATALGALLTLVAVAIAGYGGGAPDGMRTGSG